MTSSAMASSSMPVTPGRTAALTAARASATTNPARRIRPICSSDLIWMRGWRRNNLLSQCGQETARDLVHGAHAVDLHQQPTLVVAAHERLGLLGIDVHAPADDIFGVVG